MTIETERQITVDVEGLQPNTLLFKTMRGREALGRPYEFELVLLSEDADLPARAVLGKRMTITLKTGTGSREFNGICGRFSMEGKALGEAKEGLSCYEALMQPRLWLLTRASHCRFFHDMSVIEIVQNVLNDHKVDVRSLCEVSYPRLEHCAQYRENDLDFVSRLLEREGIYYYFAHEGKTDVVVLIDAASQHRPIAHAPDVQFQEWLQDGVPPFHSIYRWRRNESVEAKKSSFNGFDLQNVTGSVAGRLLGVAPHNDAEALEIQDQTLFHTQPRDAQRYARVRLDAHEARAIVIEGQATARGLAPGGLFEFSGHPRHDQNGKYLLTELEYELAEGDYIAGGSRGVKPGLGQPFHCRFRAIPANRQFRMPPTTRWPIAATQTAIVLAEDSEVETDNLGRVKVQFHWEHLNPPAEGGLMSRCWVRVAQSAAGQTWGAMFWPRKGQEVVVSFLNDDVNCPIVIGSVYNAQNEPPYRLPKNKAISGFKTRRLAGGNRRHELRFDDDAAQSKDCEGMQLLLYTDGRYDQYVKKSNYAWAGENAHTVVEKKQLVKVGEQHLTVSGAQNVLVEDDVSLDAGKGVVQRAGKTFAVAAKDVQIKGANTVVIEAERSLCLKVGASFVTLKPTEVSISGTRVKINSGGKADTVHAPAPRRPEEPRSADDGGL